MKPKKRHIYRISSWLLHGAMLADLQHTAWRRELKLLWMVYLGLYDMAPADPLG